MPLLISKEELEKSGIQQGNVAFQDLETRTPTLEQPKTIGGFLPNILQSGARQLGAFAETILHPIETVKSIGKTAIGTAELLMPGEQEHERYPKAIFEFYKERYGSPEKITKTLYEDPVGALLDLSVLAGGIGGVGRVLTKTGEVSRTSKLGEIGRALEQTGKALEPTTVLSKTLQPIKPLAKKPLEQSKFLQRLGEYPGVVKESVAQIGSTLTGAPVETFENILPGAKTQTRAKVFRGIMENPDEILSEIHNSYKNAIIKYKQISGQEYAQTLKQLDTLFKEKLNQILVEQRGKQLSQQSLANLRSSLIKNEILNEFVDILNKAGVKTKINPKTGRIESLNFKNSRFAGLRSEQNLIKSITNLLQNEWSAYGSLEKLEKLEQNLRKLLETSTGKFLRTTGKQPAFADVFNIDFLNRFRGVISKYVPEYNALLKHTYREFKMDLEPKLLGFLGIKSTGQLQSELAKQNLLRIFNNAPTLNAFYKALSDLETKLIARGLLPDSYLPELTGLMLNPKILSGKEQGIGIFTRGIRGTLASQLSWLLRLSQTPEIKFLYNTLKKSGIPAERIMMALTEGMIPETQTIQPENFELPDEIYNQ